MLFSAARTLRPAVDIRFGNDPEPVFLPEMGRLPITLIDRKPDRSFEPPPFSLYYPITIGAKVKPHTTNTERPDVQSGLSINEVYSDIRNMLFNQMSSSSSSFLRYLRQKAASAAADAPISAIQ